MLKTLMEHTMYKIVRAFLLATLTVAIFLIAPSGMAQPGSTSVPVAMHVGNNPHADNGYDRGTDHVTFDKDQDVGDGYHFTEKVNAIDSNFFGPNLINGECENTSGPCVNVQEVCFPDAGWAWQWDRNYFASDPKHGRIRLNPCDPGSGRDVAASCRTIMQILGSHEWQAPGNNTCLDVPLLHSEDSATEGDFRELNCAYSIVSCRQPGRVPGRAGQG